MAETLQSEYAAGGDAQRKRDLDEAWQRKLAAREEAAAERERAKAEARDPAQDVDAFHAAFKGMVAEVQAGIRAAEARAKGDGNGAPLSRAELAESMSALVGVVADMQKALAAATLFLPPYDVRQSSERIAMLTSDIEKARMTLAPRKKFAFNKKKPAPSKAEAPSAPTAPEAKPSGGGPARAAEALLASVAQSERLFEDMQDTTVAVEDVEPEQNARFRGLTNCEVRCQHQTGALRFAQLRNCRVLVGPVAGSCFVEDCHDCTFYVASRQVRIHDSTACDFYLHVLSRPIIEHCSTLRFAPYMLQYDKLQDQLTAAGLQAERAATLWQDVDDFRWLRQQQSPNWSTIPPADRKPANINQLE